MAESNTTALVAGEEAKLDPHVAKRVQALQLIHEEIKTVDIAYHAERVALEAKYKLRRDPIYARRRDVVSGAVEPEVPAEEGAPEESVPPSDIKGIPNFWLTAIGNHQMLGGLIQPQDIEALTQLNDITVDYDENYTAFTVSFFFNENQFFENAVLRKKYNVSDFFDERGPTLNSVEGSEIAWKEGKNLTVKELKKKQKAKGGKNKGQVRVIVKQVPTASFFNYFAPPKTAEDEEENEEEEEEARLTLTEEEDFEIGYTFKAQLVPDAVHWFTGEACEDDFQFDEEDDEDEEDEDGEGEEDEDEEEVEDRKPRGRKNKGLSAPTNNTGAPGGEQPECKQN